MNQSMISTFLTSSLSGSFVRRFSSDFVVINTESRPLDDVPIW
jgi:hypothetical protein